MTYQPIETRRQTVTRYNLFSAGTYYNVSLSRIETDLMDGNMESGNIVSIKCARFEHDGDYFLSYEGKKLREIDARLTAGESINDVMYDLCEWFVESDKWKNEVDF